MCHLPPTSTTSLLFQGFQVFHFSPWLKAFCIRKVCDTLHLSFIIISAVSPCVCLHLFHSVILNACCCYCSSARSLFFNSSSDSPFHLLSSGFLSPNWPRPKPLPQAVSFQSSDPTVARWARPVELWVSGEHWQLDWQSMRPKNSPGFESNPWPTAACCPPSSSSFPVISRLSLSSQRPQKYKRKKNQLTKILFCFALNGNAYYGILTSLLQ